jgi:ABC-type Na+ transport system ATPase subunit NatA
MGDAAIRAAIHTKGLRKRYGGTTALDGLDLTVPPGTVRGLLGPNGAGKTTVIQILATLLRHDGGTAEVAGIDVARHPAEVRRRIGLLGQHAALDEILSGRQNLRIFGRLHHLGARAARTRTDELLDRFALTEAANRQVKTYSGGMRRRLDLAATLIMAPAVLFLDEPTTGLDPRARAEVWDAVRALVREGTTVLLTTQYLDEADQLADTVSVIDHTHHGAGRALAAVALLLLLRFALLWAGIYLGLSASGPEAVVAVQVLVWPLGFLSNIFAAPATMPGWLGAIAGWNPLSATVSAARELFGDPGWAEDTWPARHALPLAVAWPLLITAVFLPLSVRRYRRLGR